MSVSSTVFGYHVQYLYTLYRMIESADSKEVFVPEGREDLDIYLNDQIIETIQVKCYSGTIVYSDLFSKGKSTSLFSRGKDSLDENSNASNPQPIGFSGILLAKRQKFILLYIFLAQQKCRRHKIPLPHKAT